jgi:hypothetical protein
MLRLLPRRLPAGSRFWLFVAAYGLARLALGVVRLDPAFLFGLQVEQLLAAAAVALAASRGLMFVRRWASGMIVTLYMKPDCHLCEEVLGELRRLASRYPHQLQTVDITSDPLLLQRYAERIPVLVVGGREYVAPLSAPVLERALRAAG